MNVPVTVRQFHRIIATLWLLSFVAGIALSAAGVGNSAVSSLPAILILVLAITGVFLLLRPWVRRYRTG